MKSYGQYCAVARALDVVGDRWSLLIVRELLDGARRYGELREGLPGIATNLLADRLRHLADAGVIGHGDDGRYELTAWGEGLREPLYALARWSAPVVMSEAMGDDAFRPGWLAHPLAVIFPDVDPERAALVVELRVESEVMTVESSHGRVTLRSGPADRADLVLTGGPDLVLGLLTGSLDPSGAAQLGLEISGDASLIGRLRPTIAVVFEPDGRGSEPS